MKPRDESVRFPVRGHSLVGSLFGPPDAAEHVILLHGLSVDRDEYGDFYVDIARALAELGIASLRFDFAGHGRRSAAWRRFSVVGQILETVAAIDWIARRSGRPTRIGLVGTSFGAPPAIFAAHERANLVDRVALVSPVLDYAATFLHPVCPWGRENFDSEALARAETTGHLTVDNHQRLPISLFDEMRAIDPMARLQTLHERVLILHGAHDSMVPVGPARLAGKLAMVDYQEVGEMDHGPIHHDDETGEEPRSRALREELIGRIAAAMTGSLGA